MTLMASPVQASAHPSTPSPNPLALRIPRVGEHVFYIVPGKTPIDALVSIVFGEHGMPRLTIFVVRPGGGDVRTHCEVPHRDHALPERPYYIMLGESV
jgi:hypothetical protein